MARAGAFGVAVASSRADGTAVLQRVRSRRAAIAPHDAASRLSAAGVDLFLGSACFASPSSLGVEGTTIRFRRAVIATGSRPVTPDVPGLDAVAVTTTDTFFEQAVLPGRLLVLGGGPIGCELSQACARLGSVVTLVERGPRLLPREDAEAATVIQQALAADGVAVHLGASLVSAQPVAGAARVTIRSAAALTLDVDQILLAVGRRPQFDGLGLGAAGIDTGASGLIVDDRLRTTNRRVYAAGDVCEAGFTHAADAMARLVVQNALFFGRRRVSRLVVPRVVYTSPELAQVGVTADEASARRLSTITIPLDTIDRAIVDGDGAGFVRVHHDRGRVRGCTVVAPHAGDLLGEAIHLVTHGGTLGQLSDTIHPYPTVGEALRKAGDAYRRESLTPAVRRWLSRYFRVWR